MNSYDLDPVSSDKPSGTVTKQLGRAVSPLNRSDWDVLWGYIYIGTDLPRIMITLHRWDRWRACSWLWGRDEWDARTAVRTVRLTTYRRATIIAMSWMTLARNLKWWTIYLWTGLWSVSWNCPIIVDTEYLYVALQHNNKLHRYRRCFVVVSSSSSSSRRRHRHRRSVVVSVVVVNTQRCSRFEIWLESYIADPLSLLHNIIATPARSIASCSGDSNPKIDQIKPGPCASCQATTNITSRKPLQQAAQTQLANLGETCLSQQILRWFADILVLDSWKRSWREYFSHTIWTSFSTSTSCSITSP